MLSDEQKNRILDEEIYRIEVKKQLDSKEEKNENKLLSFFNSNLGLFILSSCVLSLITWGYTSYSNYLNVRAVEKAQMKKLEYEVGYRLEVISKMTDTCYQEDINNFRYAIKGDDTKENTKTAVFEAFDKRGLFCLIYEYNILLDREMNKDVYEALKELQPLLQELETRHPNAPGEKRYLSKKSGLEFIRVAGKLSNWKTK